MAARVEEAGGELDDGALLLTRTVSAEGRSRAYARRPAVPVGAAHRAGRRPGRRARPADQQRLLQPGRQREALDRYAGDELAKPLARLRRRPTGGTGRCRRELDELTTAARERAQEADLLRFGLDEIEAVDPQAGEDAELRGRGGAARARRRAAPAATERRTTALLGDPDREPRARRRVDPARLPPARPWRPCAPTTRRSAALADRLAEAGYLLADVAAELAAYAERSTPTRPGWRPCRSGGPR